MPIPFAMASRGEEILRSCPRSSIRPASAGYIPYSTRISVDLPAPFSPIKRMNLAGSQLQADVVIGDDTRGTAW